MKRTTLIAAATAGLIAIGGSVAWADNHSSENDAAELAQFVTDNPALASVIADLEAQSGGTVTEAEFEDDMGDGTTHVEFEVTMADGSDQDYIFTVADGSMALDADDHDEDCDKSERKEGGRGN